MNRTFLGKIAIIALLMLLLMIPLGMIQGVIGERSQYRQTAQQDIAASWTGAQNLLGPVLVLPYTEHRQVKVWDKEREKYRQETRRTVGRLVLLPSRLSVAADVRTEQRSRGIYEVPLYEARLQVQGHFELPVLNDRVKTENARVSWQQPFLSVVVSDIRGVATQPGLQWGEATVEFLSGSRLNKLPEGMHAPLPAFQPDRQGRYAFRFDMALHGMERLAFSPAGRSTEVRIEADWPHPSFMGRYLPTQREISQDGFSARWQVSAFSSNMRQALDSLAAGQPRPFLSNTFGVSLIDPVDIYLQTERAVKYAALFLVLTFVAFFLFEVMKSLRLHPMQYLLVGMALSLFYLLLVSLSEHMDFAPAYLASTLACVGLIGIYLGAVLRGRGRALGFSAGLLLLYGLLFGILRSEDNALLMGSLLLFALLALVMTATRRLDWYAVAETMGRREPPSGSQAQAATVPEAG